MTQLELVKHEKVTERNYIHRFERTVVAVSSSYSALEEHCQVYFGQPIEETICDKELYYTIQQSEIRIVPSKF